MLRMLASRAAAFNRPAVLADGVDGDAEHFPRRRLAAALRTLQRRAGTGIGELAQESDLSVSYVSRVLSGERVPAWPVVHMLTDLLGGDPGDLRLLWEVAQGSARPPRPTMAMAAKRFTAAVRGLHLAAGQPAAAAVCASFPELTPSLVQAVLAGETVPDWRTTSVLVTALEGQPETLRALWEDMHYRHLVALRAPFMPPGLKRAGASEAVKDGGGR